jgi:hypothetical protein
MRAHMHTHTRRHAQTHVVGRSLNSEIWNTEVTRFVAEHPYVSQGVSEEEIHNF